MFIKASFVCRRNFLSSLRIHKILMAYCQNCQVFCGYMCVTVACIHQLVVCREDFVRQKPGAPGGWEETRKNWGVLSGTSWCKLPPAAYKGGLPSYQGFIPYKSRSLTLKPSFFCRCYFQCVLLSIDRLCTSYRQRYQNLVLCKASSVSGQRIQGEVLCVCITLQTLVCPGHYPMQWA